MKNGDYNLIVCPQWYKGKRYRGRYCYEHHLVWEKEHGQPVPDGMIVHHKDGNKFNNAPDNLELISVAEHAKLHGFKRGRAMVELECPCCGKHFVKEKRKLFFDKKVCFCSRQCSGKFYGDKTKKDAHSIVIKEYRDYSEIV